MATPPKVFISATSGDLRGIRQIVKEALLTIHCHPIEQTNFAADWRTVADMLRGRIEDCQALIHIAGLRYGAEPDPGTLPAGVPRRSYTQLEYHLGRQLQAELGEGRFRVYTFLCPEDFPYDAEPVPEVDELRALQRQHRAQILDDPHLRESPRSRDDLRARILTLQEPILALEQEQQSIAREEGALTRQVIVTAQADLAAQMSQVQEAISRLQQQTDPTKDPISAWPQERLEAELARQMEWNVEDLRALLATARTSLDALVAGQALLASGQAAEAGEKFDTVIAHEQAALQRLRQAYAGKAQIAYDQARYEEALDYRQKAAALVDKAADPIGWAYAQGGVTFILLHLARYREAEPLLREILRLREQHLGPDAPDTASALNNLAQGLKATNRLPEAEPLMRRALQIDEVSFGPEHRTVARDLNNLVLLLHATNRLPEAEPLMRRALQIDEAGFGPEHPTVAIRLNNLALVLKDTNRLPEAEPLVRRALKIDEASFGPEHPTVARDLSNLAHLLQATNRLPEAEPLMRRVVSIFETAYGKENPNVAASLNNLARLLQDTNRLPEAEPLMRRALQIDEASFGPEHPDVARVLNNLAQLLQNTKRLPEAEPLMRRALQIDEASFGPDHPNVARDLSNLALLLEDTTRLTEADPLMRRAVGCLFRFQANTGHRHQHSVKLVSNYLLLARKMNASDADIHARLDALRQETGLEAAAWAALWQEVLAANPP